MAVTKLWKVSVRLGQVLDYTTNPEKTANPEYSPEDYQALKDVLAYAKDEDKTEHEFFCDGINCNVAMARDQFITVKEQFGKTDGIQAYHGYLSFKENEVTPEQAEAINAARARGGRIVCVGTTSVRTLETVATEDGVVHPGSGFTQIFITPGVKIKAVDALITNFHLPQSTLLMLISALMGRENALDVYRQAVEERYRFFSFGDAMMITGKPQKDI